MKTLTLNVPDNLEVDNKELAMLVATSLYQQGKLSLGQAAEVGRFIKTYICRIAGQIQCLHF